MDPKTQAAEDARTWRERLDEARARIEARDAPGARDGARAALDDAIAAGSDEGRARSLLLLAECDAAEGDWEPAITRLRRVIELASACGLPKLEARAWRDLGVVHDDLADHDEALAAFLAARALRARLGDRREEAGLLNSIGITLSRAGDHARGLQYLGEAVALAAEIGDAEGQLPALNNMGINLRHLGRLEEARDVLGRVLSSPAGEDMRRAAMNNLARVHAALGDAAAAEEAFRRSLGPADSILGTRIDVDAARGLGELLTSLGRLDEARPLLLRALELSRECGWPSEERECHLALSVLLKAAGDFEAALRHHEAFHEIDRRLFNASSDAKLRSLQIRHQVAELERQTLEDGLTGLANRRRFDRQLAAEIERARRAGTRLCVALCDLDDFKAINDGFTHVTGDDALRGTAEVLTLAGREGDLVARFGGEEFALLLPAADEADAARRLDAARTQLQSHAWSAAHPELRVTVSIGWTELRDGDDGPTLLRRADECLYAAKRAGKNRVAGPG